MANKTVLITGASGGLGLEFARLFAADHWNVALVARSASLTETAEEIARKYSIQATPILCDLAVPGAANQVIADLKDRGITVFEALVNNAGFATYGEFVELDLQRELELIQLNCSALVHLSGLLLPAMKARRAGKILNVASTAAFAPGPLMANYYASKAFVVSFSQALNTELAGTGVTVTAFCPGATDTGFQQRAAMTDSKLLVGVKLPSAAKVAKVGYDAMMRGQNIIIQGSQGVTVNILSRLLPRSLASQLIMNAQSRSGH